MPVEDDSSRTPSNRQPQKIDGVQVVNGDTCYWPLFLYTDCADPKDNGIWMLKGNGEWERPS